MIPKIIHQIYWDFSGNNKPIPDKWIKYSKILKKNNPNWAYKLWNYESCLHLLKKYYPWFLETYNGYEYPIQKVDSIRPFILYHYGGIYFDMDFVCIKNISEYFNKKGIYILESSTRGLANGLMASSKKHPFWKIVIIEMMKHNKKKLYHIHHTFIMNTTGPYLITRCYKKYKKQNNDIYILSKNLFNPCDICSNKCKISKNVICYTITEKTWFKLDSKIVNYIYCNIKIIIFIIILILFILLL